MHRTIGYLSKRFVQVRPGEGRRVLLTFLYFFLIITSYYLIKPVSRSLVLGELGSRLVPYVDLICAILMGPVVTLFARVVDRVAKPRLVSGSFLVVIGILFAFWNLLRLSHLPWVAGAFYVWVSVFSVLVVTMFWLVANDLYRPREAKRLFGFIGSGGILGGVVGSSIAAVGAQLIGTDHLLLLSVGILACCWLVVQRLWALAPERAVAEDRPHCAVPRETFLSNIRDFVRLLGQSRYLLLLVTMVGLNKLVATLTYYQLNPFIEEAFPDEDARTTFMGMFLGGMNTVSFIVQFFFTSWILRRWGLFVALLLLPLGLLGGMTTLLLVPVLAVAALTELYDGSMNYSLQQTTKEVLYLPIDRSIRYKVKPFIDMVVFRLGKGLAALIGIILLDRLHVPARFLGLVAIPLLAAWVVAAIQLRRDYIVRIRTILQARAASRRRSDAEPVPDGGGAQASPERGARAFVAAVPEAPPPAELFGSLMDGQHGARKLALMDRLMAAKGPLAPHGSELLAELAAYESRLDGPLDAEASPARLRRVVTDQREPVAVRCQALRWLTRAADQETVDYLFGVAVVETDLLLRQDVLKALVRIRLKGRRLEFPVQPIRRQVAREVAEYQRIVRIAAVYRQHHRGPLAADDAVMELLRVLLEESVDQIFRLLMLLYRPEDIHLVYEQMRAPDAYVRADAIELLDNLVDPVMRPIIAPILDEDRFLALVEEPAGAVPEPADAYRLLQGAIWDHNCWLSVTTLCAVGRLRLPTMRQELEKATRHAMPMVSKAAKVALLLATLP